MPSMVEQEKLRCVSVPAGAMGMALGMGAADNGNPTTFYYRRDEDTELFNISHQNPRRFPGITFPDSIEATSVLAEAVCGAGVVILAAPSHVLENVFRDVNSLTDGKPIILCATKGMQRTMFAADIVRRVDETVGSRFAVIAGPNLAGELAERKPTIAVIASTSIETAEFLQRIFDRPNFRVYVSQDVIGVSLAAAAKNVVAMACGIGKGLHLGEMMRSIIVAKGLGEIIRLGIKLGADSNTFFCPAVTGDLVTTCHADSSRNFKAGRDLVDGIMRQQLLNSGRTIEAIDTAQGIVALAEKLRVSVPVMGTVWAVLDGRLTVKQAGEIFCNL